MTALRNLAATSLPTPSWASSPGAARWTSSSFYEGGWPESLVRGGVLPGTADCPHLGRRWGRYPRYRASRAVRSPALVGSGSSLMPGGSVGPRVRPGGDCRGSRDHCTVLGDDGVEPLVDVGEDRLQFGEDCSGDQDHPPARRAGSGQGLKHFLRGVPARCQGAVEIDGDSPEVVRHPGILSWLAGSGGRLGIHEFVDGCVDRGRMGVTAPSIWSGRPGRGLRGRHRPPTRPLRPCSGQVGSTHRPASVSGHSRLPASHAEGIPDRTRWTQMRRFRTGRGGTG